MLLNSLHADYIQKSRLFLYPLLKIRRGVSTVPVQTYMAWKDMYKFEENKFIVVYHKREDLDFKSFERAALLDNYLFEDMFELEDNKLAYVFDFSNYANDYGLIRSGKYSMLTSLYKKRVLYFFRSHRRHLSHVESYLFPEKYYETYSKLLNVKEELLKEVGQLCSKPNLRKEILQSSIKMIDLHTLNLKLPDGK